MQNPVQRKFIDGPYGQIHTRIVVPDQGDKPPVVCLHMSPKSGRSFAEILPYLAVERVALAPDYPGHGESAPPPAEPHVRVEDFAASTWRVIDSIGSSKVHLLGYHTGAMVAVEAASQRPDAVKSIISISAPVFTEAECAELDAVFSPIPIDEEGSRFRIMWERVLEHRGPGMTLQMAADSFAENLRAGDDYEWGHRAAFTYSPTYNKKLGTIRQPVLVINPADDCFEQSRRADDILINGRRIDHPEWGHGFLQAYPEDAAREINEFIQGVECND